MNISEISIRNPVFAWMLMAGLIFFGWIGFSRMGVSEMPDVDFPFVTVSVTLEGSAPEIMETEVVDVLEDSVMSVEGIRSVSSAARQGNASITVEFELGRDIDVALQEVQTKITQAQRRLPTGIDPPVVTKTNPEDQPIMWVALSGKGKGIRELIEYADRQVKPFLQTVEGVGDVFLGGFLDRNLRVWLKADRMAAHEITAEDVLTAIGSQHAEIPAGRIETKDKEFNVRVMGEALTVTDFENIILSSRGGRPIYSTLRLKDIARIEDGTDDVRRIARVNGEPAIGLGIRKQRGSNAVQVADGVKARLADLNKRMPTGFSLGVNFDSTKFIKEAIGELNFTLILSALLTGLVCFLFLGTFNSTLNVLLAIPTSVLGTFVVLYFFGFTLNTFTLLGLSLAIGIVVDDAIMVLENITRHGELGKSKFRAALDGSREITFAAIAATVSVAAIFLPVAFMKGIIGKFFFQFGVTITVAVGLSLLEALTLAPMRASQFSMTSSRETWILQRSNEGFQFIARLYRRLLAVVLEWKWTTILISLAIFVSSYFLIGKIRREFTPQQDMSIFLVRMQAPIGSSIEYTDQKFQEAEKFLRRRSEVTRYFGAVGGFGGGEVDSGVLFVTMVPPESRKLSQAEFIDVARKELNAIGGIRAVVQDLSVGGFSGGRGFPVELSIRGPDLDRLGEYSQAIMTKMEASGLFVDVDSDFRVGMPEVRILPDREKAARRGVSMESIGQTINAAVGGIRAGKYTKDGRRYDVRVRLERGDRLRAEDINALYVRNNLGEVIPLSEVVTLSEKASLQTIRRKDRERAIGLNANLAKGVSQAVALEKAQEFAKEILPDGYSVALTGSAQTYQESFQSLLFALLVGIAVAYMVLASQFNSFVHPFTVLLALPFSVTGGLLGLWVAGKSLNVFSMIGLLLLMGIVKKNSILLVDFTNQVRRRGLPVRQALLEACPTRLRPIVMTSTATVAAAIPPALALGPGAETRIPMAVAVIGGVTVSTLLTLLVIPCAYELLSHLQRKHPDDSERV